MTADDTRAFRAALRRLEIAYGCPVDSARDPVYFDALEHYPIATVVSAANDLANRHRTASGRFPITHDWIDRCREFIRATEARQQPMRTSRPEPDDDTPPITKAEFWARIDTLRKKCARVRPGAHRHSSLTPLSQIADSLTHPHALPATELSRAREPGEDDLPLEETPVQADGAEDDPDAV